MPGGNDNEVNALYEIACNTRQMAINAGATPPDSGFVNDEAALSNIIACNMALTITGLGGTCLPTWVDQATAWQAILIMSVELASLTGTPSNQGFLELPLAGVLCNLEQVATNTGASVPPPENLNVSVTGPDSLRLDWDPPAGPSPDSYNIYRSLIDGGPYTLLVNVDGLEVSYDDNAVSDHKTYYYVLRSVVGGIESVDSNQASGVPLNDLDIFINNLLPFAPDLLIIADSKVGNNGDPVPSAPDSSGHNNPMEQANGAKQPILAAGPNGKKSYQFDGTDDFLQCPFAGLTKMASVVVFARDGASGVADRIASLTAAIDGTDAGIQTPVSQYLGADVLNSYYNGVTIASTLISDTNFHSSSAWLDGTNGNITLDGAPGTSSPAVETALPGAYAVIGGLSGGGFNLNGKIAFHARWATAPADGDIAAFLDIVNTYYGL